MWLMWSLSETMKIVVGVVVIAIMAVWHWERRRDRKRDAAYRFAARMAPDSQPVVETPNVDSRLPPILQALRRESWRTTDKTQLRRLKRRRMIFEFVGLVLSMLLFYMLMSLLFKW